MKSVARIWSACCPDELLPGALAASERCRRAIAALCTWSRGGSRGRARCSGLHLGEMRILATRHQAAIRMARELEPYGPPWIEEPVPPVNVKAWRRSPPRMRIPVATGERVDVGHELREHCERQAARRPPDRHHRLWGSPGSQEDRGWADAHHIQRHRTTWAPEGYRQCPRG